MQRRMLTDMADVLRTAGLKVIELPGWQQRGESDGPGFDPIGLLLHHDAMALGWNSDPDDDLNVPKYMSQNGNLGSQLWVSRYGVWVTLAAGRKWHAGAGNAWGDIPAGSGNSYWVGVETDHTDGDPWPKAQLDAIDVGSRALVQHYGWKASNCAGHLEYAPARKHDPSGFDLGAWRAFIAAPATPAAGDTVTYTVRAGDTLSAIAASHGTTVAAIAAANGISDPNKIQVGQVLRMTAVGERDRDPVAVAQARLDELQASAGMDDAEVGHLNTAFCNIGKADADPELGAAITTYLDLLPGDARKGNAALQHIRTAQANLAAAKRGASS